MTISSRVETWCAKLVHPGCWSSPGYAYMIMYIYIISIQHIYIHTCSIWIHFFTRRIREKKLVSTLFLFATFISWVTFSRKTNLKWNEERHGWPRALRLLPVVAFGSPDGITGCRELPGGSDVFPWKWWENYDENDGKLRNSYFFQNFAEIMISLGVIIRNGGFLDMYMQWFIQMILFPCIVCELCIAWVGNI